MEFLDIGLTRVFRSMVSTVPSASRFYRQLLYSGLKIPFKKICKKTRVYSWKAYCRAENEGKKPDQNSSLRRLKFYAQKPQLKMPLKNSISVVWKQNIITRQHF